MIEWRARGELEIAEPPYPMPHLIWRILKNRAIHNTQDIQNFLSPKLKDLKNPFSLKNMQTSVGRLIEAYQSQEIVAIYADFDLDGTSGLALLYEGLKTLGFKNVIVHQPRRLSDGYGLHVASIQELAEKGVKLIITVDVGITANQAAEKALELGLDLIITDHHQQGLELPRAFAVINPNQSDDESGLGYLCGAGVAFYLLMALKNDLSKIGVDTQQFNLKDVLEFFVIGTLTDMVPLTEDNRVLIKHGLLKLSQTERPGLKYLMQNLDMWNRPLTSQDVAIGLAPKLNALSRMEEGLFPRDVLMVRDDLEAQKMVSEVLRMQSQRKALQSQAVEIAAELRELMNQDGYVWVWSHEFHKGVIGLVATQFVQRYGVPCFVGTVGENGKVTGSARLPEDSNYDLTQILRSCSEALKKYGGHTQAAGFELELANTGVFDKLLQSYFQNNPQSVRHRNFVYDTRAELNELNTVFMKWLDMLEPFGKSFPTILLHFENLKISKLKVLNGGHLRLNFISNDGSAAVGLMFSPPENIQVGDGDTVSILAQPQWNYFNGSKTIQLLIKDLR